MTGGALRLRGPKRFEHQTRALRKIVETRGVCALLMEPGTGKTATTLDYVSLLALKMDRPVRVLVLSPLAAVDTWVSQSTQYLAEGVAVWAEALGGSIVQRAEAITVRAEGRANALRRSIAVTAQHGDGTPGDPFKGPRGLRGERGAVTLLSLNLDAFGQRRTAKGTRTVTTTDRLVHAIERFAPDLVVVDESHRIKSPSSNTSRAVSRLHPHAPRRLLLTGTVMPHSPLDVWAQWRFLAPEAFSVRQASGRLRAMSFAGFKARYAQLGGYMGKEVVGFQRLDEMRAIMARNSIVVKKSEALDLPPVMDVEVPVVLSARERKAYESMHSDLAAAMSSGEFASAPNRLAQAMRLRQITSGFLVDGLTQTTENLGASKAAHALSLVNDTLAGEKRVVVFCHFVREAQEVVHGVKGGKALIITGATPAKEREAIRRRFGSDNPERLVLVAQMRTLSLAVNELVTASHAVFLSCSERRDDWVQARDRLNRLGQTGQRVTFWNLVVKGSVDEAILKAHRDRETLESALLTHIGQPLRFDV